MRKRIVIALLAIVVIGVVAFMLTRPKPGTVEWHKREYWAAKKALRGSWQDRLRTEYHRLTKTPDRRPFKGCESDEFEQRVIKMVASWDALVSLGYLNRYEFYLIYQPKSRAHLLEEAARIRFPPAAVWSIGGLPESENFLVVYATSTDLPQWRELVRRFDAPARTDAEIREQLIRKADVP